MNDIKTRPKTREVKVRDAAALAPKELSKLLRDSGEAKQLRQREPEERGAADSAAVRDVQSEYEGDVKDATACGTRKAYSTGKHLAQKRYDEQFRAKPSQTAKQADHSAADGQPVPFSGNDTPRTARTKREYRKTKVRQRQERGREIKLCAEQTESRRTAADLCQQDIALGEASTVPERPSAFGRSGGTKAAILPKEKAPIGMASVPKSGTNAPQRAPRRTPHKKCSGKWRRKPLKKRRGRQKAPPRVFPA